VVRRRDAGGEAAFGLFCALRPPLPGSAPGSAEAGPQAAADGGDIGVEVEPVVIGFEEPRVRRTLENAVDREADAAWRVGDTSFEMWCIDDESATARVRALLEDAAFTIEENAAALERAAARGGSEDDDELGRASALAFLHPRDDAWPAVPVGAVLLSSAGPLA
jgi:hypothetical protein